MSAGINIDTFNNSFLTQNTHKKQFNGLRFVLPENFTCISAGNTMNCKSFSRAISFKKIRLMSPKALPLMRNELKRELKARFRLLNNYEETQINVAGMELVAQKGKVFKLDNINLPVLLRLFDVVIKDYVIRVEIAYSERDRLAAKVMDEIVLSMTKDNK